MKYKKIHCFLIVLSLIVLFSMYAGAISQSNEVLSNRDFAVTTAEWIRNSSERFFTASNSETELLGILGKTNGSYIDLMDYQQSDIVYCQDNRFYMTFEDTEKLQACLNKLAADPNIIYAMQDCYVYAYNDIDETTVKQEENTEESQDQETDTVPESSHLSWGAIEMESAEYATHLNSFENEKEVIVAIIDSGAANIEYLSGRLVEGYDFVDNETDTSNDTHPTGHGTYLSSIIVDCTPELPVKIMPIRVLSSVSGSLTNVINGIYYAADAGADVINISLGGRLKNCQAMDDAINYALDKDIPVVVCAGNESSDAALFCPSHNEDVITVSAVDSDLKFASSFSNFGQTIDIASPGVDVCGYNAKGILKKDSGTSMSTAYISACVAMINLQYPDINCSQVELALRGCTVDLGDEGWDKYYGYGFPKLSNLINSSHKWVTGIVIPEMYELNEGDAFILEHTISPKDATNKNVNWTSSDESVVRVENGMIIAVSAGEANVVAETEDGKYQSICKITVYPKYVEKLVIVSLPYKLKYKYGEDIQLDGMELQGQYSGGIYKEIDLSQCKLSGYDSKKIGDQTVIVEYDNSAVIFVVNIERTWWQKIFWILSLLWLSEV